MKYGISALCIAALVLLSSGCKRTELEDVDFSGDVLVFAMNDSRTPESKSGAAVDAGDVRTITLKSDTDEMVLYRTEKATETFVESIPDTKGAPATTANIGKLYKDQMYAGVYTAAEHNTIDSSLKLAYESRSEGMSIWRATKQFEWPEQGSLDIWAWAPNNILASRKVTDSEGKMTFTYTMPAPGTATKKTDAEAQQDIILGHTVTAKPQKYVEMTMDHALTALRFEMDNTTSFKVKSIKLGGVYSAGTCTYKPGSTPQIIWTDLDPESKKDYTQDFDQTIAEGTEDAPQEIGPQEATFMVIPQCATGGNAISFDMTIEVDGVEKHYTASLKNEDWKAGVTYTYGIDFDGYEYEFKLVDETQSNISYINTSKSEETNIKVTSTMSYFGVPQDADWKIKSHTIDGETTEVDEDSFTAGGYSVSKNGNNLSVTSLVRSAISRGSHDYWINSNGRTEDLDWSPAPRDGVTDLSMFNFQTEQATSMTTANCYIIRHAGTYKLPLVYGNAVVNGEINAQSYYPNINGDVSGGNNRLDRFVNSVGAGIESPFIENAEGCGGSDLKCAIVWQDQAKVIQNITIVGEIRPGNDYSTSTVRYLQFEVPQSSICQNNALICIYKDKEGGIADQYDSGEAIWSWHIWTTNDPALLSSPISVKNYSGVVYKFFPLYTLGWIAGNDYPKKNPVKITLAQINSGNEIEIEVNQEEVPGFSIGCSYQFGRKDPMCMTDTPAQGSYIKAASGGTTLAGAICNPNKFYLRIQNGNFDWCKTTYNNLWTGKKSTNELIEQDDQQIKTIYDPSPIGYKVPAPKAFTGFSLTGTETEVVAKFNVNGYFNQGWFVFCEPEKKGAILYFPTTGVRHRDNGDYINTGTVGYYRSAVAADSNYTYFFYFYASMISPYRNTGSRSYGFSVRPVIDSTMPNNTQK